MPASRTWFAAAVVVVAAAVTSALAITHVDPFTSASPPRAPAGTKWVGVGRTVYAVPSGWEVWPELYCGSPNGRNFVTVIQRDVTAGCMSIDEPGIRHGQDLTFLASRDGALSTTGSSRARAQLPRGWLAVPRGLRKGWPGDPTVRDVERAVTDAGFRVRVVRVPTWGSAGPPVTTEPETGTPARVGSMVVVQEHVAALADSGLRGTVDWVGGPSPGIGQPHQGMVHITGNRFDDYVVTDPDGTWRISLPPGTYRVSATSPGYGSPTGGVDACQAARTPVVRPHEVTVTEVDCQLK